MPRASIHIGTSGWQYPDFRTRFYPPGTPHSEYLAYFASRLGAVELNYSFYHQPSEKSFAAWRDQTPPTFQIAIKAHRAFTHAHRLLDPGPRLEEFLNRARILGPRLGPILFQLAASFQANLPRLKAFLRLLPSDLRFAFELRHPSWWQPRVMRLLESRGAAFCIHDLRCQLSPCELTADFTYVRLHGPLATPYCGAYSERALERWADRISRWNLESYIFFDNTTDGDAITDALYLQALMHSRAKRVA